MRLFYQFYKIIGIFFIVFCMGSLVHGQQTIADFTDEYFGGIWNPSINESETILGVTFDPVGKMYLWTKNGKVFSGPAQPNSANLMLDISYKVYEDGDAGMLGFALDPNYMTYGFVSCYRL